MILLNTPSGQEMIAALTRFTFPIQTLAYTLYIIAWLSFSLNIFFVSLHTETLQKPYSKHTQTKEGS